MKPVTIVTGGTFGLGASISIELAQLRRIPLALAVVSGTDRTAAIEAAIRGGLIKGLVIDEVGAAALLMSNASSPAAPAPRRKSRS